jgi:single-strand DNA-binding protein
MSNTITIVGNLTREPEVRYTSSGRAVCNMGVASSRRYQQNGEWTEQTTFFNLTAWGSLGENAAASLHKGDRVVVSGRMESREYEVDGVKKTAWDLIVDEMGPSLRWARADIEKIKTEQSGSNTPDPAPAAKSKPANNGDPVYGDNPEEPF